jgi:AhpD family alkylhydroperoxidase
VLNLTSFPIPHEVDRRRATLADVMAATSVGRVRALARLRASQLNHCPSCIRFYTRSARQEGETRERLERLAAWRHVTDFTPAERAVLAWTEALTRLDQHGAFAFGRDVGALRTALRAHFTDAEVGALTVALRGPLTRCTRADGWLIQRV